MSNDEIKFLMELAIFSPTSHNQQNWKFITITDQKIKGRISKASYNQPQPADESLVVVLCGNTNSWKDNPARYWKNVSKER